MAAEATRTLRPEDEISHYRIVGPIGAGGMGDEGAVLGELRSTRR